MYAGPTQNAMGPCKRYRARVMSIEFIVCFIVVLLVLAIVAEPLAAKLRLPHSSLLVLLGAGVAYFVTLVLGVDTRLRASNFHDLIFFVFLPVLIFEAAFEIPQAALGENIGIVLFLAIVGMLLTTLISAAMLYFGIGHPNGFPWIAALLAGALLAATDPVAVVTQLKTLGAPQRLGVVLEGESLFNDATAIVVFSIFLTLAAMPASEITAVAASLQFLQTFLGGSLVGAAFGLAGAFLIRRTKEGTIAATVTLAAAYGSYLVAESLLHVSGVMGTLAAGLLLARAVQRRAESAETLEFLWSALAYLANGSVFLLMGATITVAMFQERWLAMLIAIAAVIIARACTTFGCLAAANLLLREPLSGRYQTVIVWGGLRGAVTLGLALSLPTELDYWFTIQSMAFGVVLFTLLVQAPTMPWLVQKMGLAPKR